MIPDRAQQLNHAGAARVPAPAMAVPPPPSQSERNQAAYERGIFDAGVAEGRRQATEGFDRDEEWAISYSLNGDPKPPEYGGHIFDSRAEAERHLDTWRRHYPDQTYADEVYHRREVLTGPWEADEPASDRCADCGLPVEETPTRRDKRHDHCGPGVHTGDPVGCERCA